MMAASCSWPLLLVQSLLLITLFTPTVLSSPSSPCDNRTHSSCYRIGSPLLQPHARGSVGNPIAGLNTWWENREAPSNGRVRFTYNDGSIVRPLLLRGSSGPSFACGFFCTGSCNATLFSVFLVVTNSSSNISDPSSGFPQVVWSANRNNPVGEGASLQLTTGGDLVLSDSDGTKIWSTGTLGKSVAGVNLTEMGNLVLYSFTGETVWQSFHHPTDTVLQWQSVAGLRLIANASATNSGSGKFYLDATNDSFSASIDSDGAFGIYYNLTAQFKRIDGGILIPSVLTLGDRERPELTVAATDRFMRLERDGHLRLYIWSGEESIWKFEKDVLTNTSAYNGECIYPTVCGEYGICSTSTGEPWPQCSCPPGGYGGLDYFQPVDQRKPNHGCSPAVPLSCQSPTAPILFPLENISYLSYVETADLVGTDVDSCKDACLNNCSCKAAFFKIGNDPFKGDCYLPSHVFSLMENLFEFTGFNSSAFIKVQRAAPPKDHASKRHRIMGSTLGAVICTLLLVAVVVGILLRRRRKAKDEVAQFLSQLQSGTPARFSYKELKSATGNFSRMLGEGGFGSVFQGTLPDGMSVAVKLLGGKGQGMKEFVAEVETIGSIHHVNLVRLVGYCAHKLHRLLVYEYMCNGSLDKWVFHRDENPRTLDWQTRHKIIFHVAKGLAYLHEECRHRIAHLDIKPENILLDEGFNAKVSDFGLSKLIDRDQSRVVTTMRGTPGYLAPEWLSSMITEKVDVFSFGVVVLETVCGRRNIDCSRPKPNISLVDEARSAEREDRVLDIVDRRCQDYPDEAMKLVRIALCCLRGDPDKRPQMSVVVKVLEGVMGIEPLLEYDFPDDTQVMQPREVYCSSSTPMLAATLSGPR